MTDYILELEKVVVIATYSKGGGLKRLNAKKGFVADAIKAGHVIAYNEKDIEREHWKLHEPQKADAFYSSAIKVWAEFFQKRSGFGYRFSPTDGKALKSIGSALTDIGGGTEKALDMWKYLTLNWDSLPDFYRDKPQLNFINSQLNTILNLLKNGKATNESHARNSANNIRANFG